MEPSQLITTVRSSVCLFLSGLSGSREREQWPDGADEFVRRLTRQGVDVTIVGPRPSLRLGNKKHFKFFDRHDVVGFKRLSTAKAKPLELRVLSHKLKAWTRIRADVCVVSGSVGVWPRPFPGWTSQGVLALDALARFVSEFQWVPGRRFLFLGSDNRNMIWASHLLELGAEACMVVESGPNVRSWRAHRDRLLARGGRVFVAHELLRIQDRIGGTSAVFLRNKEGTLVLDADTVVISSLNQEHLNSPAQWKKGLFYIQRRDSAEDPMRDESVDVSKMDWSEVYWRVARTLEIVDHGEATNAIERVREDRRSLWSYRKQSAEFTYVGKNLSRESFQYLRQTGSVPKEIPNSKPVASLECAEKLVCRRCVDACPHEAISKPALIDFPRLNTDACTGCGACVAACPASAAIMVREVQNSQNVRYFLPDHSNELWKEGEPIQMLNRRGELLASGKVIGSTSHQGGLHRVLEIESPAYNLWDARMFRKPKKPKIEDETSPQQLDKRGWITLNNVKRLSPLNVPATVALWKMGYRRFEDALFCSDGSCHLCEVKVNGKSELACRAVIKEGDSLEFTQSPERSANSCFCAGTDASKVKELVSEGVAEPLARELTGYGLGVCKGVWCESREGAVSEGDAKPRPCWAGFLHSPWRDLWLEDVLPITRQD